MNQAPQKIRKPGCSNLQNRIDFDRSVQQTTFRESSLENRLLSLSLPENGLMEVKKYG
jgi:hypothetical protein